MKQRFHTSLNLFASSVLVTLLGIGSAWALAPQSSFHTTPPVQRAHNLLIAQAQENQGEQMEQKGIEEEKTGVEEEQRGLQEEKQGIEEEEKGLQEEKQEQK